MFDNELNMRDDGLSPGQFHGGLDENGSEWLRQLQNYCAFRGFNDVKSLALMKVLLTDAAANWVESLDEKSTGTYAALVTSFKSRYMQPDALKYKSAKELYSRKQKCDESAVAYIETMTKLAREVVADVGQAEDFARFAILNGLKSNIANFVLQREPKTLSDVVSAARIAEMTSDTVAEDVSSQIQKLHAKIDRMTVATSTPGQPAEEACFEGRYPFPVTTGDKRVSVGQTDGRQQTAYAPTLDEAYTQQGDQQYNQAYDYQYDQLYGQTYDQAYDQQYLQQQWTPEHTQQAYTQVQPTEQYAPDYAPSYAQQPQQYTPVQQQQPRGGNNVRRDGFCVRGGRGRGMQQQYTNGQGACQTPGDVVQNTADLCTKCGRKAHLNQLQCAAINKTCYICQRLGHLAAVCRAAMRGRIGPSNANTTRRGAY